MATRSARRRQRRARVAHQAFDGGVDAAADCLESGAVEVGSPRPRMTPTRRASWLPEGARIDDRDAPALREAARSSRATALAPPAAALSGRRPSERGLSSETSSAASGRRQARSAACSGDSSSESSTAAGPLKRLCLPIASRRLLRRRPLAVAQLREAEVAQGDRLAALVPSSLASARLRCRRGTASPSRSCSISSAPEVALRLRLVALVAARAGVRDRLSGPRPLCCRACVRARPRLPSAASKAGSLSQAPRRASPRRP